MPNTDVKLSLTCTREWLEHTAMRTALRKLADAKPWEQQEAIERCRAVLRFVDER